MFDPSIHSTDVQEARHYPCLQDTLVDGEKLLFLLHIVLANMTSQNIRMGVLCLSDGLLLLEKLEGKSLGIALSAGPASRSKFTFTYCEVNAKDPRSYTRR